MKRGKEREKERGVVEGWEVKEKAEGKTKVEENQTIKPEKTNNKTKEKKYKMYLHSFQWT